MVKQWTLISQVIHLTMLVYFPWVLCYWVRAQQALDRFPSLKESFHADMVTSRCLLDKLNIHNEICTEWVIALPSNKERRKLFNILQFPFMSYMIKNKEIFLWAYVLVTSLIYTLFFLRPDKVQMVQPGLQGRSSIGAQCTVRCSRITGMYRHVLNFLAGLLFTMSPCGLLPVLSMVCLQERWAAPASLQPWACQVSLHLFSSAAWCCATSKHILRL